MPTGKKRLTLRDVIAQLPCFVCVIDRKARLRWSNAFDWGLKKDDLLGGPADAPVIEEDKAAFGAAFRRALHLREVVRFSVRLNVPEPPGVARCGGQLSPVVAQDGRVRYVVAVAWDATDRTPAEPPPRPAYISPDAQWLTPIGVKIVDVLRQEGGWVVSRRLAELAGEALNTDFRATVRTMEARGILETCNRRGVRLLG